MSASGWSEIKWPGSALVLWLFTYRPEREGNRLTWSTLFHWPEIFIPVWERWLSPVLLKFTYEWQTGVTRIRLKEKQFSWCFCVSFMWKKKGGNKKWNYFFSIYENMTSERWKHFVWELHIVPYCPLRIPPYLVSSLWGSISVLCHLLRLIVVVGTQIQRR